LNDNAENSCKEYSDLDPLIFYGGDQNTFFDKENDGKVMIDLFKEKRTHLSSNLECTFKSFPQDKFQGTSVLDHIFVNTKAKDRFKLVDGVAEVMEDMNGSASDHFLVSIRIII
jgi:hypothetical protein